MVCRVNLVLVGAEGVVENGGIINKLGSYHIAIAAKENAIPFYVAAESYKVIYSRTKRQTELQPVRPLMVQTLCSGDRVQYWRWMA